LSSFLSLFGSAPFVLPGPVTRAMFSSMNVRTALLLCSLFLIGCAKKDSSQAEGKPVGVQPVAQQTSVSESGDRSRTLDPKEEISDKVRDLAKVAK